MSYSDEKRLLSPLAGLLVAGSLSSSVMAATTCDVQSMQAAAPKDTTVVSAELLKDPVAHCQVEGYVTTTNPGPNRDNFRLQLPARENWNKRFFFIALGGSGGYVPTDAQFPSGDPIMAGYAAAGTDKGHQEVGTSGDWEKDPAKELDNAHRGAHVVTVATQQMTKAYYGVDKMYRYQGGCSGGGQMGIQSMQIYPTDYDGVLLGWPGGRPPDPKKLKAVDQAILVREMNREPGSFLSLQKRNFVQQKVVEACDATDGAKDGVIWDQRLCHFDFKSLLCKNGDAPDCLTKPEVTSFENILRDSHVPISNINDWGMYVGDKPPPWDPKDPHKPLAFDLVQGWTAQLLNQPDRDTSKQPLTDDEMWQIITKRAANSGLGEFPFGKVGIEDYQRTGGKAIFFVGEGDPCCSSLAMMQYFDDLIAKMGKKNVDEAARLYVVPGWGHCGGALGPADGTDKMMEKLVAWVEQGKAPTDVVTHRGAERDQFIFASVAERKAKGGRQAQTFGLEPPRDFLLCPYPQVSVFDKSKANVPDAVYDAKNWSCRASRR